MPATIPASTTPTIFNRPRQGFLGTSVPSSLRRSENKIARRTGAALGLCEGRAAPV